MQKWLGFERDQAAPAETGAASKAL